MTIRALLLSLFLSVFASSDLRGPSLPPFPQPIGPLSIDVAINDTQLSQFDGILKVAAVVPYDPSYPLSFDAIGGWKLWEFVVNNVRSPAGIQVAGKNYAVNVTIINCNNNTNDVIDTAKNLTSGQWGTYDMVFSPPIAINEWMQISEPTGLPTITPWDGDRDTFDCGSSTEWKSRPPCTGPNMRRYKTLWGILPPSDQALGPVLELLKLKGSSTISLWCINTTSLLSLCSHAEANARHLGYQIQTNSNNSGILIIPPNPSKTEVQSLIERLILLNGDVVVAGTFSIDTLLTYIHTMRDRNYAPRATVFSNILSSPILQQSLKADLYYYLGYTLWSPQCHGGSYLDNMDFPPSMTRSSPAFFNESYFHFWNNESATEFTAMAYAGGYVYEGALLWAGDTNRGALQAAFPSVNVKTFFGGLSFDGFGMSNKSVVVTQMNYSGLLSLVYPFDTALSPIVYPFVLWTERDIIITFLGTKIEQVMLAFFIIEIIYIILSTVYIIKNWSQWSLRASPIFLCFVLLGSLMMFLSVPFWMLYVDITACYLRIWLITLGSSLLIGCPILLLLVRRYPDKLSERALMLILGVILLIDIVTLSVGTIITKAKLELYIPPVSPDLLGTEQDGHIWQNLDYYECTYVDHHGGKGTYEIIMGLIITFKVILMVFGFYFSLFVYKKSRIIWVHSKPVIYALYNAILWTILCTIIVFALHNINNSTRNIAFVLRSLCIFIGGALTPLILFHPDSRKREGYSNLQTERGTYENYAVSFN